MTVFKKKAPQKWTETIEEKVKRFKKQGRICILGKTFKRIRHEDNSK